MNQITQITQIEEIVQSTDRRPLRNWNKAKSDLEDAKSKGLDIIAVFRKIHNNVAEFEQKYDVQLPEDIAAMLTQG